MKITPLDIQQQQFKGKMFGGIDADEVDSFLQMVAQEMEELVRENTELREQVKRAAAASEEMERRERDLRETMLAAQKVIDEMHNNAQKEAQLRVSEAEVKAERLLVEAEQRSADIRNEIAELRRQKVQFESGFKALLESYSRMLSLPE